MSITLTGYLNTDFSRSDKVYYLYQTNKVLYVHRIGHRVSLFFDQKVVLFNVRICVKYIV